MYYKTIDNNIIVGLGISKRISDNMIEISDEEYSYLMEVVSNKPEDTLESIYRLSAETNQYEAFTRTHDETVEWYVQKVTNGEMTIDEVPEDYKAEVKARIPTEPTDPTIDSIIEEVASNGY